jgi:hypothetical protein
MVPTPEIESNMETAAELLKDELGKITKWQDFFTEEEYQSYIVDGGLDGKEFSLKLVDQESIELDHDKFLGRRGAVPNNKQTGYKKMLNGEEVDYKLDSKDYRGFEIATNPTETINNYLADRSGTVNGLLNRGIKSLIRELGINVMNLYKAGDLEDSEEVQVDIGRCLGLWSEDKPKLRVGYVLFFNVWIYAKEIKGGVCFVF